MLRGMEREREKEGDEMPNVSSRVHFTPLKEKRGYARYNNSIRAAWVRS